MPAMSSATSGVRDSARLARSLLRLARTGAYARPAAAPATDFEVLSPRNDFASPIARICATVMAEAQDLGWITTVAGPKHLQLSKIGRRALKREIACPGTSAPAAPGSATRTARVRRMTPAAPASAQRVEGPLLWLRNRKDRNGHPLITQAQYEAGTRFSADFVKGQMQPRITASWSAAASCLRTGTPGSGVDLSDAALAARDRFHEALAVVGPEMGQLLIDVCCLDIGLESAERTRRWPVRSGKVVLDMGLTTLARHYGLEAAPIAEPGKGNRARPAPRRWADPGFTPTLSTWSKAPSPAASRDADATASA